MPNVDNTVTVSILMLTYNHEAYIAEALDSILMQEVDFLYEIVVGEDCSSDNTRQILMDYQTKYPDKFKLLLHDKNIGAFRNMKTSLAACTGKYIAILEGDDYWTDRTKLQKQVQFLETNSEYVITYTNSQPFDKNGPLNIDFGGATRDVSSAELKRAIPLYTLTVCFRNVIPEIPEEFLQVRIGDVVISSLLGSYGGKGKYLSNISPAAYRVHDGGVHSTKSRRQKQEMSLITSNVLFAYYARLGDADTARYFREFSFRRSLQVIGWRRIAPALLSPLLGKWKKSCFGGT